MRTTSGVSRMTSSLACSSMNSDLMSSMTFNRLIACFGSAFVR